MSEYSATIKILLALRLAFFFSFLDTAMAGTALAQMLVSFQQPCNLPCGRSLSGQR
jgi:hypothetical protein